jgi:hypothetical protein
MKHPPVGDSNAMGEVQTKRTFEPLDRETQRMLLVRKFGTFAFLNPLCGSSSFALPYSKASIDFEMPKSKRNIKKQGINRCFPMVVCPRELKDHTLQRNHLAQSEHNLV